MNSAPAEDKRILFGREQRESVFWRSDESVACKRPIRGGPTIGRLIALIVLKCSARAAKFGAPWTSPRTWTRPAAPVGDGGWMMDG